jgi:hypothetical protein
MRSGLPGAGEERVSEHIKHNRKAYQLPVHSFKEIFQIEFFIGYPEETDCAGTNSSLPEE